MFENKFCPLIQEKCKGNDCAFYISENCAFCDISKSVYEVKESIDKLDKTLKAKS